MFFYHLDHFLHHPLWNQVYFPFWLSSSDSETRFWFVFLKDQDDEQSQFFAFVLGTGWSEIPKKIHLIVLSGNDRWRWLLDCNLCPVFNNVPYFSHDLWEMHWHWLELLWFTPSKANYFHIRKIEQFLLLYCYTFKKLCVDLWSKIMCKIVNSHKDL